MADQARVTSLEALESFRASLILFVNRAHRSLDEAGDEVRRTRQWMQHDQRLHWENELRRRQRFLDLAVQELMTARMSNLRDNVTAQEEAVRKWKRAVQEAEDKLRKLKIWNRDFDHFVDPLARKLESVRQFLDTDLPKAIVFLLQAQRTLEDYAEVRSSQSPAPPPAPAPADSAEA